LKLQPQLQPEKGLVATQFATEKITVATPHAIGKKSQLQPDLDL
jgi:hypothetical protein